MVRTYVDVSLIYLWCLEARAVQSLQGGSRQHAFRGFIERMIADRDQEEAEQKGPLK